MCQVCIWPLYWFTASNLVIYFTVKSFNRHINQILLLFMFFFLFLGLINPFLFFVSSYIFLLFSCFFFLEFSFLFLLLGSVLAAVYLRGIDVFSLGFCNNSVILCCSTFFKFVVSLLCFCTFSGDFSVIADNFLFLIFISLGGGGACTRIWVFQHCIFGIFLGWRWY